MTTLDYVWLAWSAVLWALVPFVLTLTVWSIMACYNWWDAERYNRKLNIVKDQREQEEHEARMRSRRAS